MPQDIDFIQAKRLGIKFRSILERVITVDMKNLFPWKKK